MFCFVVSDLLSEPTETKSVYTGWEIELKLVVRKYLHCKLLIGNVVF